MRVVRRSDDPPHLRSLGVAALVTLLGACAPARPMAGSAASAPFAFGRDTLAFANLVRAERPGLNDAFANYCIVMARAAAQFHRFARFEPEAAPVDPAGHARLARDVLAIDAWAPSRPPAARVAIPGYASLHDWSRAQGAAVKAALDSNLLSMMHWRTWRVGVALSPDHQRRLAAELAAETAADRPVVLMITNYPHQDLLNHAVLVYRAAVRTHVVEFLAYDPNDPGTPLSLYFRPDEGSFWIGPVPYSPPGRIRAFRLYASRFS